MAPQSETEAELIEAIQELTASRERIPTMSEFVNSTEWRYMHVERTFSDWQTAIEAAGIDLMASLETELQRVAEHLGHHPTPEQMDEHGRYPSGMYQSVFDSWEDAIASADLDGMADPDSTQRTDTDQETDAKSETPAPVTVTDTDSGILDSIVSEFETQESG